MGLGWGILALFSVVLWSKAAECMVAYVPSLLPPGAASEKFLGVLSFTLWPYSPSCLSLTPTNKIVPGCLQQ